MIINKIKAGIFVLLASATGVSTQAQNTGNNVLGRPIDGYDSIRTITTAVPFLTIAPDARAGAMGEAGVALTPDANSIHWNTAKLAFVEDEYSFSTSYTPWLRSIINDMSLSYLSGYKRVSDRGVFSVSLLYFDLGEITFTDINANDLGSFTPKEYAITGGYATQLSEKLAVGLNLKFINSNLSGNAVLADGTNTRPGRTAAGDISIYYNNDIAVSGKPAQLALAATMSNVGAKISYTNSVDNNRDFLPANLKVGGALKTEIDQYQSFTASLDLNKYLVPSPPIWDNSGPSPVVLYGVDPDTRSVPSGIFGSFNDATGLYVEGEDGSDEYVKGSKFKEELSEIIISAGGEYWYRDILAFRAGYFREHRTKGNRQFLTFGVGVKYQFIGVDIAYLSSLTQNNPLANTLRFTLNFSFDNGTGDGVVPPTESVVE